MVSAEEAKRSVGEFLRVIGKDAGFDPHRVGELVGAAATNESPNVGPMWAFESPFGSFWVSQASGQVVRYVVDEAESAARTRLDPEAAQAAALSFIRAVYQDFDKRNFKLLNRDVDAGVIEFDFEEIARAPETSIFSNFVRVSVNTASGRISRYSCSNLPFKRTSRPRITESEARRIIAGIIAPRRGIIDELRLMEEPVDGASRSVTVWSAFVLYPVGPEEDMERLAINADTGETFEVE